MGAVKDADEARIRHSLLDAPEEVVSQLVISGGFEAGDLDTLRVDQPDGVAEHASFAAGVHPLENEQDPSGGVNGALCPEFFLKVRELVTHLEQGLLAIGLLALEAR